MRVSDVVIFSGWSLDQRVAAGAFAGTYLPPVSQGDLVRAVLAIKPRVIGIVDGLAESVPAIWHKEILWAMTRGIHVFGCSGIGALRAVELADFGMEGVGSIFDDFRSGRLESDDEVAIDALMTEQGWVARSEAMVNVRASLAHAAAENVISGALRNEAIRLMKRVYYRRRGLSWLASALLEGGAQPREVQHLIDWWPTGRIDQMRIDAMETLAVIQRRIDEGLAVKQVRYRLEESAALHDLLGECGATSLRWLAD